MKTYLMAVMIQVEVEAMDSNDAKDVVNEYLGDANFGALQITGHEILDEEVLD